MAALAGGKLSMVIGFFLGAFKLKPAL